MAQSKEFLPLITTNDRIRRVYGDNSTLSNVEYTRPVSVVTKYEAPIVQDDPSVQRVVHDNLRVIILPEAYYRLDAAAKKAVTVMSSPFECGRVLEADKEVLIDGVPHTVNFKGVGATTMVRNGEIGLAKMINFAERLRTYPFYLGYGELDLAMATAETSAAIDLRARGIDTERVLGIYKIASLPDQNGEYVNPAVLREEGVLAKDNVIIARASKSNFRLLDPVTMYERGLFMCIPRLREVVLDQFAQAEQQPADMQTYLQFLTAKLFRQELPLIAEGYEMCAGGPMWQNLARNISVLGEELDLESVEPSPKYVNPHSIFDYAEHISTQVGNLDHAIRSFADTLSFNGQRVDFGALAHFVWDGISTALHTIDYQGVLETMPANIRKQLNFTGPDSVLRGIFKTIEGSYWHAVYTKSNKTLSEEDSLTYKRTIVSRIQVESKGLFN